MRWVARGMFGAAGVLAASAACGQGPAVPARNVQDTHFVRRLPPGAPGTIEAAIAAYQPKHVRPVDEGMLPPRKPGRACPAEMASVDDRFCVDRWEASVVERAEGGERAHAANAPLEEGKTYVAKSVSGVLPQAYVSAAAGEAACRAAGKRLCQPVEWRAACAGTQGYAWSYGPAHEAGRCNDRGKNPILLLHPPTGPRWPGWNLEELNDPRLLELEGTIAKTGVFVSCVNDLGVHDMVGNLHEWTADPNGTFQGGYFLDTTVNGEGCAYRTTAHHFGYHDYSTGFRCCSD